jgi:NAD(P)-dependent dehydrogenase (short-subunit alcohol dehydrogenase family)
LVSGASGALGRAVVQQFEKAGDNVTGLRSSDGDLTTPEGAQKAAAKAGSRVDVLVHCMGAFAGGEPVSSTVDETWRTMLAVNLSSAFYLCRAVLPGMLESRHGRIIAVSSRASLEPMAKFAAYSVSKAGLNALIQTIAAEVKHAGITANAILPSIIDTEANRTAMPAADRSEWVAPEALARLIFWLASSESSDINGALIPVYGRV